MQGSSLLAKDLFCSSLTGTISQESIGLFRYETENYIVGYCIFIYLEIFIIDLVIRRNLMSFPFFF